jgi:hypothetical protein
MPKVKMKPPRPIRRKPKPTKRKPIDQKDN